jgi:hypothetical protein
MVVIRWLSLVLLVLALMLLGADSVTSLEQQAGFKIRSLDTILLLFNADLKPWVMATFSGSAQNAITSLLAAPAWAVAGVLGVVFSVLTPNRRIKAVKDAPPAQPIKH